MTLFETDGDLAIFMLRLTIMHARRWLEYRDLVDTGHVYQGRYKSFMCEGDSHFLLVARYIERNPLRAKLVSRAELWRWSSLAAGVSIDSSLGRCRVPLSPWPFPKPANWTERVNQVETAAELEALRKSAVTGKPFGTAEWSQRVSVLTGWRDPRRQGRPRKAASSVRGLT